MNDRDALLAAITAEPDDDTPRLVYADWLDEHGEGDRTEFIRVQCRQEHVSRRTVEGKRLAARVNELQLRLFGHLADLGFTEVTYRRGFVGAVVGELIDLDEKVKHLEPHDAPAYELVVRDDGSGDWDVFEDEAAQLFATPTLRGCVSLDLPSMGMGASERIFASDQLTNLRRLNMSNSGAGPNIGRVASPTFANLRWANFYNGASDEGLPSVLPLAECPHLANLEHLNFGSNRLGDADAKAVAAASQWTQLRYLCLSSSSFSAEAIATLFATPHLPALTELELSNSFGSFGGTEDAYISGIVGSPLFRRLAKLWLWGDGVTDAGAKALAEATRDVKLELLALTDNPIGGSGRRALWKRFGPGVCVFGSSHA